MAIDHGGWQTVRTSGAECPIGGRRLGLLEGEAELARAGCLSPMTEQGIGGASKSVTTGVQISSLTATQSTILKYCELQYSVMNGEPSISVGSVIGERNCCDMFKTVDGSWRI